MHFNGFLVASTCSEFELLKSRDSKYKSSRQWVQIDPFLCSSSSKTKFAYITSYNMVVILRASLACLGHKRSTLANISCIKPSTQIFKRLADVSQLLSNDSFSKWSEDSAAEKKS
jgi:hypothetical protein